MLCSVLDDNDNRPEFMQSSFEISLPENLPPGAIHTVQAVDPDLGENGTIHYSIVGEILGFSLMGKLKSQMRGIICFLHLLQVRMAQAVLL